MLIEYKKLMIGFYEPLWVDKEIWKRLLLSFSTQIDPHMVEEIFVNTTKWAGTGKSRFRLDFLRIVVGKLVSLILNYQETVPKWKNFVIIVDVAGNVWLVTRYSSRCDTHQSWSFSRLICVCLHHHDGSVNGQIEERKKMRRNYQSTTPSQFTSIESQREPFDLVLVDRAI